MLNSTRWFTALRVSSGARSNYHLAQIMGVTQSTVSGWSNGKHGFGPELSAKVADFIHVPPQAALVAASYWKATSDEERMTWQAIYNIVGGPQVDEKIEELATYLEAA